MFKKKNKPRKIVDKTSHTMISSDTAYLEGAKALKEAYKLARFNRDMEAMIAISDRWTQMARILEMGLGEERLPIGFSMDSEEKSEHHHS